MEEPGAEPAEPTRSLVITCDEDMKSLEVDDTGFALWEVLGIAHYLVATATHELKYSLDDEE